MHLRTALTLAGSDPGGGAGIQADLKTFLDHRVFGLSVVTALTVQTTAGVRRVQPVDAGLVRDQFAAILEDAPVHAIKTGMLGDASVVHAVCELLEGIPDRPPLVVDPVLVASDGTALLSPAGLDAFRNRLLPLATLVTPNLPEAAVLGPVGVPMLLKGGHAEGPTVEERLIQDGRITLYRHRRVTTKNTHGTGCTLSAAIAARLAGGDTLDDACRRSIRYVSNLILRSRGAHWRGAGPLLHGLRHR